MDEKDERDLQTAALVLTPLEVAAPFFGPTGVMTAIVVAVFGGVVTQWISRKAMRRLQEFLEQLQANVNDRMADFEARLSDVEEAEDLAFRATRAAANSTSPSQARGLANVLAEGVLGATPDHAKSELLIAVLDGLTLSEIEGLRTLALDARDEEAGTGATAVRVLSRGRVEEVPVAEAVVSRLVGRGLLQVEPPGFGGFEVTSLGREALRVLDEGAT
ncbi:MAG TPA: hypothetical protein VK988_08330 [Acidimicrobiales bacterium]|nr:hypothetical protein [Acidimicrobiales bacterium]